MVIVWVKTRHMAYIYTTLFISKGKYTHVSIMMELPFCQTGKPEKIDIAKNQHCVVLIPMYHRALMLLNHGYAYKQNNARMCDYAYKWIGPNACDHIQLKGLHEITDWSEYLNSHSKPYRVILGGVLRYPISITYWQMYWQKPRRFKSFPFLFDEPTRNSICNPKGLSL